MWQIQDGGSTQEGGWAFTLHTGVPYPEPTQTHNYLPVSKVQPPHQEKANQSNSIHLMNLLSNEVTRHTQCLVEFFPKVNIQCTVAILIIIIQY